MSGKGNKKNQNTDGSGATSSSSSSSATAAMPPLAGTGGLPFRSGTVYSITSSDWGFENNDPEYLQFLKDVQELDEAIALDDEFIEMVKFKGFDRITVIKKIVAWARKIGKTAMEVAARFCLFAALRGGKVPTSVSASGKAQSHFQLDATTKNAPRKLLSREAQENLKEWGMTNSAMPRPNEVAAAMPEVMVAVIVGLGSKFRDPLVNDETLAELPAGARFPSFPALLPRAGFSDESDRLWGLWNAWAEKFDKIINSKNPAAIGQWVTYRDLAFQNHPSSDQQRFDFIKNMGLVK